MLGEQLHRRSRLGYRQTPSLHDLKWTRERQVVDAPFALAVQWKIDGQADDAASEQRASHGLDHALLVRREAVQEERSGSGPCGCRDQQGRRDTLRFGMQLDGELRSAGYVAAGEHGCVAKTRRHGRMIRARNVPVDSMTVPADRKSVV